MNFLKREFEGAFLTGELLVHTREGVELVLGSVAVLRVQVDLEEAGAVQAVALALADDLRRVNQILQQSSVHRGEGAASRARARHVVGRHRRNASVRHDHHILAAELLLEFAHQALLNLVVGLQRAVRHVKDNRGAATGNGNFGGTDDVEVLKFSLKLSVGGFEVNERLLINQAKRKVRARSVSGLAFVQGELRLVIVSSHVRPRARPRRQSRSTARATAEENSPHAFTSLDASSSSRRRAFVRQPTPATPTNPKTTPAPRPRHHALESQRTWPTDSSNAVSAAPFGLTIYFAMKRFVRQSSVRVARRETARMSIADQSPRPAIGPSWLRDYDVADDDATRLCAPRAHRWTIVRVCSARSVRTFKVADILDRLAACKGGCVRRRVSLVPLGGEKILHWWLAKILPVSLRRLVGRSVGEIARSSVAMIDRLIDLLIDVRVIDDID